MKKAFLVSIMLAAGIQVSAEEISFGVDNPLLKNVCPQGESLYQVFKSPEYLVVNKNDIGEQVTNSTLYLGPNNSYIVDHEVSSVKRDATSGEIQSMKFIWKQGLAARWDIMNDILVLNNLGIGSISVNENNAKQVKFTFATSASNLQKLIGQQVTFVFTESSICRKNPKLLLNEIEK